MTLKEILNSTTERDVDASGTISVEGVNTVSLPLTLTGQNGVLRFVDESSAIHLMGHGPFCFRGLVFRHEAELGPNFICCDDASVIFLDCTFEGAYGGSEEALAVAVKARGRSRVTFEQCHFQDNDIHLQAESTSHLETRQCLLQGARADGIRLQGQAQFWAQDVEVTGSGWSGLSVSDQAAASLEGSTFQKNGCHGAEFGKASRYDGQSNLFKENGYHGLCLFDDCRAASKADQALGNGLCGVDLSGNSCATFQDFQLTHNIEHGIQLRNASRGSLRDCTASENGKSGLALFSESGLNAEDLTCDSNALGGVQCSDRTHLHLIRAQISLNQSSGVVCFGKATMVVERSRFNDCGGHGIQVADECQALLRDCEVMENRRAAILFAGSARGVVESCTLAHNTLDGLVTSDRSKVTAIENIIRNNSRDGLLVLSCCNGQFLENQVQGNERFGIYAGPGARPLLSDNECDGNSKEQILLETALARSANRQAHQQDDASAEIPAGVTLSVEGGDDLHLPFQPKKMEKTMLQALAKHGRLSEAALGKVAKTRRVGGAMENLIDRLNRAGMPFIRHDGDGPEGTIYTFKVDTSRIRKMPRSNTQSRPNQGRNVC